MNPVHSAVSKPFRCSDFNTCWMRILHRFDGRKLSSLSLSLERIVRKNSNAIYFRPEAEQSIEILRYNL